MNGFKIKIRNISDLSYMDGTILKVENTNNLQDLLMKVKDFSGEKKMTIKYKDTKLMTVGRAPIL